MFDLPKFSNDYGVNFRSLANAITAIKEILLSLFRRLGAVEDRTSALESAIANTSVSTATTGSANSVVVNVDFGSSFNHWAQTVVTGETWIVAKSRITVTPLGTVAGDEVEIPLLSFQPVISDIVVGDGFTLSVYTPVEAKGTYSFSCVGA